MWVGGLFLGGAFLCVVLSLGEVCVGWEVCPFFSLATMPCVVLRCWVGGLACERFGPLWTKVR